MSGPPPGAAVGQPAPASSARPPIFSLWLTAVYALVVATMIGAATVLLPTVPPLERLERPEDSLDRLAGRQMDLWAAGRRAPRWQRALASVHLGPEPARDAAAWYEEAAAALDSPRAELYARILAAEAHLADPEAGPSATEGPARSDGPASAAPAEEMGEWLRAAYPEPAAPDLPREHGGALIADIREMLPEDWFADTLVTRVAARGGDMAAGAEAEAAILERGGRLLARTVVLASGNGLLVLAAAGLLVGGGGRLPVVSLAALPPVWVARDGVGLFARGAAAYLITIALSGLLVPAGSVLEPLVGIVAGLPLLVMAHHCLSAYGTSFRRAFGLSLPSGAGGDLARATVVLVGLSVLADAAIALGADQLGLESHWADGFPEELLWATPLVAGLHVLDTAGWTPLVEEIGFRGVLYGTLRRRVPMWPAALASAAVFAAAHGYGVVGFASVGVSGLLWALAYERTRSLLPGMIAHGVNNLLVAVDLIWLLRV